MYVRDSPYFLLNNPDIKDELVTLKKYLHSHLKNSVKKRKRKKKVWFNFALCFVREKKKKKSFLVGFCVENCWDKMFW